jgi:polar amino acid transport system substrate-binding protein
VLTKEYARLLGVKIQPVLVSHETKVPVLASNQVDLSITPLAETPERLKAIDFVIYSATSVCMFGRADNPRFSQSKSVDDLNRPDVTIAYFIGGGEEGWVKERFPKAKLRGVTNSGATAPVEEVMSRRADAAPINRVPYVGMAKKVKGLSVLPSANDCQGSMEKAAPVGLGVDKNQAAFTNWLRAVANRMKTQLDQEERKLIDTL